MSTVADELTLFIFDNYDDELATQFQVWLGASRRFRAFVATYRDKIRKKWRIAGDGEARRDLLRELEVARQLAEERAFAVEYETTAGGGRGPDFTVTFRGSHVFHVEVKRIRPAQSTRRLDGSESAHTSCAKLVQVVCDALGQLPAGEPNVLLLYVEGDDTRSSEVVAAMKSLKERAERKDESFFQGRGFDGARDFLKYYSRLSAVLALPAAETQTSAAPTFWINKESRRPLPSPIGRILQNLARQGA